MIVMPVCRGKDLKEGARVRWKILPLPQLSADFALDALAGDFLACSAAPVVKSEACVATETAPQVHTVEQLKPLFSPFVKTLQFRQFSPCLCVQLAAGADSALDALSDTLKDITPKPKPAPAPVKDTAKVASEPQSVEGGERCYFRSLWLLCSLQEKKIVEERLIKMGERDDTLPPEYRPTEEDRKVSDLTCWCGDVFLPWPPVNKAAQSHVPYCVLPCAYCSYVLFYRKWKKGRKKQPKNPRR